ncbi:hypothetical protein AHAS_Ahas16G0185400 [Arachis hypogaea]
MPVGTNAIKMYGRGTPVLNSIKDSQSPYMAVARQCKFLESNNEGHKRGVARQAHHKLWVCHLNHWAWHASSSNQRGQSLGRATWYKGVARQYKFPEKRLKVQKAGRATWCRRRGTPALNPHLGVPLEDPGVACQH